MRDHDWVGVDIYHAAVRVDRLGDLVGVLVCGQAAAEVEELRDALPGQPLDRSGEEKPALPGETGEPGADRDQPLGFDTVG
jgi:hypothetical protein